LKKFVEQANILEPGQGGGRQGCVSINMQKVYFIQPEARRQGKRVYRVDIDFKNTFDAMSQAAIWQVMRMFKIPDVDLLEQTYEGATVRLAPNDEESATITFNTGVAQLEAGKVASALTCKRCTSSNRKLGGDNQQDENGYQFNNIGFSDDTSIFADTPEGMQKLLNVVQEFTAWCGMQINVKKTNLLVIDNDKKRREQEPAPLF